MELLHARIILGCKGHGIINSLFYWPGLPDEEAVTPAMQGDLADALVDDVIPAWRAALSIDVAFRLVEVEVIDETRRVVSYNPVQRALTGNGLVQNGCLGAAHAAVLAFQTIPLPNANPPRRPKRAGIFFGPLCVNQMGGFGEAVIAQVPRDTILTKLSQPVEGVIQAYAPARLGTIEEGASPRTPGVGIISAARFQPYFTFLRSRATPPGGEFE